MFSKIVPYQKGPAEKLASDLKEGRFSGSSLFEGVPGSLKLTTALECARILLCQEEGEALCRCRSCRSMRDYTHPDLIVMVQRDMKAQIKADYDAYIRLRTRYSKVRFVQTCRLMLGYYHPAFSRSASAVQKTRMTLAGEVADALGEFENTPDDLAKRTAQKSAKPLKDALEKLFKKEGKTKPVTIDRIRDIETWISRRSHRRVIILEGIEESSTGARNAILKMLEEPPEGVYFILLTSQPERMLPTVLSRVRRYHFPPLSAGQMKVILQPLSPPDGVETFEEFNLAGSGTDVLFLKNEADRLAHSFAVREAGDGSDVGKLLQKIDSDSALSYFLSAVTLSLEQLYLSGELESERARVMVREIGELKAQRDLFNRQINGILEALYLHRGIW